MNKRFTSALLVALLSIGTLSVNAGKKDQNDQESKEPEENIELSIQKETKKKEDKGVGLGTVALAFGTAAVAGFAATILFFNHNRKEAPRTPTELTLTALDLRLQAKAIRSEGGAGAEDRAKEKEEKADLLDETAKKIADYEEKCKIAVNRMYL